MPSELKKLLILTDIRDIVTTVQLLGCRWFLFRLGEGILRAEDDGIMVLSAEVRSLGMAISFTNTINRIEDCQDTIDHLRNPVIDITRLLRSLLL